MVIGDDGRFQQIAVNLLGQLFPLIRVSSDLEALALTLVICSQRHQVQ